MPDDVSKNPNPNSPIPEAPPLSKARGKKPNGGIPDEPQPPLPAAATSSPPPQSTTAQPGAPRARLDFSKARVKGLQPMQTTPQATRLPVIDKPNSARFFRVHPGYGGFAYPVFLWRRKSSGKSAGSTMRLVSDEMAVRIGDNGGDVIVAGLYWGRYSKGGDFILTVNLESDNDYVATSRSIYEKARTEWVKRINMGGYYESKPPNVPIADAVWEDKEWEDVAIFPMLQFKSALDVDGLSGAQRGRDLGEVTECGAAYPLRVFTIADPDIEGDPWAAGLRDARDGVRRERADKGGMDGHATALQSSARMCPPFGA